MKELTPMRKTITTTALLTLAAAPLALAQDNSGFLTSYDNLSTSDNMLGFTKIYIADGAAERVAQINQIMIDQPEIFIAADSKYRGAKPQDILEVSEALRSAMIEGMEGRLTVVDAPGDGAALMSWAVSNVYLKKKKRGLLGYTPVGAVAYGAKNLASDAVDKSRAYDVVIEFEVTDVTTDDILFAGIVNLGEAGDEVEFESGLGVAYGIGQRIGCRVNNSTMSASDQEDCLAIPLKNE